MSTTEIKYEINQITSKLREIAKFDLWDRYDVAYLENRLAYLRAELEAFEV